MRVDITCDARDRFFPVYVNGDLVAEVTVGETQKIPHLEQEVRKARVLEQLLRVVRMLPEELRKSRDKPDHIAQRPAAKQTEFCEGLVAGLNLETVPHPIPGVPDLPPKSGLSYGRGYELGSHVAELVQLADRLDKERQ